MEVWKVCTLLLKFRIQCGDQSVTRWLRDRLSKHFPTASLPPHHRGGRQRKEQKGNGWFGKEKVAEEDGDDVDGLGE